LLSFPNCKINIGLNIIGKRADGFHNLETVFYPIDIKDAVEIIPTQKAFEFTTSGNTILDDIENNLCVKAYRILQKDFPSITNVLMHLHKNIPMGAGLGGGSANASAVLVLLNSIFNLNISITQLKDYALQLGSDCPFFIENVPCLATGRGEVLHPIDIDLKKYKIVIVNPGIHVNTGNAFAALNPSNFSLAGNLDKNIHQNISTWKNNVTNDFEIPVFAQNPAIETIKNTFYENGALYASMSGSGSSVYGIFEKDITFNFQFPDHYFCHTV
jgi:4-diphosphocytidyl-2-C-methyl-D-erythritol kinase